MIKWVIFTDSLIYFHVLFCFFNIYNRVKSVLINMFYVRYCVADFCNISVAELPGQTSNSSNTKKIAVIQTSVSAQWLEGCEFVWGRMCHIYFMSTAMDSWSGFRVHAVIFQRASAPSQLTASVFVQKRLGLSVYLSFSRLLGRKQTENKSGIKHYCV